MKHRKFLIVLLSSLFFNTIDAQINDVPIDGIGPFGSFSKKDPVAAIGDYCQILTPLYAASMTWFKHKDKEGLLQLGGTLLLQEGLVQAMKYGLNDAEVQGVRLGLRPDGGSNNFPSGHTADTFASAWYLKKRHGFKESIPAFLLAGFTGFSRVYVYRHDMKAVGFGALVGIISAEIFTKSLDTDKVALNVSGFNGNNDFLIGFTYKL